MSFTGYRIYRGRGEVSNVDFSSPVAEVTGPQALLAGLGHTPLQSYTYVIRPVLDGRESPDISCQVKLCLNASGQWPGPQPPRVEHVQLQVRPGGDLLVEWDLPSQDAPAEPDAFALLGNKVPDLSSCWQIAEIPIDHRRHYSYLWTPPEPGPWYLTLQTRSASGAISQHAPLSGPILSRRATPVKPWALVSEQK